jgi:hypothetical protein
MSQRGVLAGTLLQLRSLMEKEPKGWHGAQERRAHAQPTLRMPLPIPGCSIGRRAFW